MTRTFIATATAGILTIATATVAFAQDATAPTAPPPAAPDPAAPPPTVAAPARPFTAFSAPTGPTGPSVWGVVPWGGIGAGARYMIPVPIPQLLTRTPFKDYWVVEFGADILHQSWDYYDGSYSWTEIVPVGGLMWQVWFTDNFAAYPKVEIGYAFGWYSGVNGSTAGLAGGNTFYPDGAAGVLYKLNNGITLRGEVGSVGARLGVGWLF